MKSIFTLSISIILSLSTISAQWEMCNGPYVSNSTNGLVSIGSDLYAGTHNGMFLSTDYGANWTTINTGLSTFFINAVGVSGTNVFAATQSSGMYTGVFISTNSGASWSSTASLPNNYIGTIVSNASYVFAGTEGSGVYRSSNNGVIWSPVNSGLTDLAVKSLSISGTNIFAGTGNGVFLSTNDGTTWTPASTGIAPGDLGITCVKADGSNVYSGRNNSLGGVYVSTNNGTNWAQSNNGISYFDIACFEVSNGNAFVGTRGGGVFITSDNGNTWNPFSTGLTNGTINCLNVCGPYLFAGTGDGKVFRRAIQNVSLEDENSEQISLSVYPNPSTGRFRIKHSFTDGLLTIKNLLGQDIYTSNILSLPTESEIDVSSVPTGIYLVTIYSKKEGSITTKIIIE